MPSTNDASDVRQIDSVLDWTFEGRASGWLYVVGVLLLISFVHYGAIPMVMLMRQLGDTSQLPPVLAYVVNHLPVIPLFIAAPVWVYFAHRRPWWSVAMPRLQIEWWNMGIGALFALLTLIISWTLKATVFGMTITFGSPNPATYWPTFLFAIAFVFMQTTCEELVFRGYAMQAVRRFTASPIAIVVITAALFAVPHYSNVLGIGWPWWGLLAYAAPAVLFAWMVLRTGSLWMPIGWHWLNNFVLSKVFVVKSDVAGSADAWVYSNGEAPLGASLMIQISLYALIILAINYLVGRREKARL